MPESADAPTNPYLPAVQKAQVGYAEASVYRSPKYVDRLQLHRYGTFTFGCYPWLSALACVPGCKLVGPALKDVKSRVHILMLCIWISKHATIFEGICNCQQTVRDNVISYSNEFPRSWRKGISKLHRQHLDREAEFYGTSELIHLNKQTSQTRRKCRQWQSRLPNSSAGRFYPLKWRHHGERLVSVNYYKAVQVCKLG